jgi:hypothetical protein
MSRGDGLYNTSIFVSSGELELGSHVSELPPNLEVVPLFFASDKDVNKLARNLASPFLRNQFEIICLETKEEDDRVLRRIGGSALHDLRDQVVEVLNDMRLASLDTFEEGNTDTWYSGLWKVPQKRTLVRRIVLAHEAPDRGGWHILRDKELGVPNTQFVTGLEVDTPRYRKLMNKNK